MSENNDHGAPGRSLLAEMSELKAQMGAIKTAMLELVDLQRGMHQTLVDAMNVNPIPDGESTPAQVV
jgi:hypothetical protein